MPVEPGASAGVLLAVSTGMVRLVVLVALLCSCKGMGGLGHVASGLGHVASAAGHVAGEVGHVAGEVGHVAAPLASAAGHAAPVLARAAETAIEIAALAPGSYSSADPFEAPDDPPPQVSWLGGPLIDNHDPCNACPDDLACGQCEGAGGAVCRWSAPGAFTRCESGLPR